MTTTTNSRTRISHFSLLLLALCSPILPALCAAAVSQDSFPALHERFRRAYDRNAKLAAAKALTEIAARFPNALYIYTDGSIYRTAVPRPDASAEERAAQIALMQQLFTQRFKDELGIEPNELWLAFVSALVDEGRLNDAVEVVPHIQSAREGLVLRVDKRFETLMRMSAPVLSLESIAKLDVENRQEAMLKHPRSLAAVTKLGTALLAAGQYEEALASTDSAIAKVNGVKSPRSVFEDADDQLTWLYYNRAAALRAVGRWSEAEVELRKSMELPERGGRNISNTINLAGFYIQTGRPDDALSALGSVGRDGRVSDYGAMQVKSVLCRAAVLKSDERAASNALEYIAKHRADAPGTYQEMLLWANRADEWAQYMIERLRAPALRGAALRELQIYTENAAHPSEIERRKRLREFADRADVRAAVAEVGLIERFGIPRP
jgi:tetratricopeptide (TPR) repeat protein